MDASKVVKQSFCDTEVLMEAKMIIRFCTRLWITVMDVNALLLCARHYTIFSMRHSMYASQGPCEVGTTTTPILQFWSPEESVLSWTALHSGLPWRTQRCQELYWIPSKLPAFLRMKLSSWCELFVITSWNSMLPFKELICCITNKSLDRPPPGVNSGTSWWEYTVPNWLKNETR